PPPPGSLQAAGLDDDPGERGNPNHVRRTAMYRIDIDAGGCTSIRKAGQPRLGNSMTVLEDIKDYRMAEMCCVRLCNLAYPDEAVRRRAKQMGVGEEDAGMGKESLRAAGYTGYLFPMPPDDRLALIPEAFREALNVYDKE